MDSDSRPMPIRYRLLTVVEAVVAVQLMRSNYGDHSMRFASIGGDGSDCLHLKLV